ncbi:MAG: hypothetical protein K9L82_02130 [Chromatiaceae bacterium]|nr:hypothetical protein [Chromatiaceae bacterium]
MKTDAHASAADSVAARSADTFSLDARIRDRLATSLAHVVERGGPALGLLPSDAKPVLAAIRAHPLEPALFGRYYDLIFAYGRGRMDEARRYWDSLSALARLPARARVVPLTSEALGSDAEHFPRLVFPNVRLSPMVAPTTAAYARFDANYAAAKACLYAIWPERAAEVDALIRLIVGAGGRVAEGEPGFFAGATCFMLWGAVFFNVEQYDSAQRLLDGLVHEAVHAWLFGQAADGPLTLNPLMESHPSPLRQDPRPMDGVYHATYVCAELTLLYTRLADGPQQLGASEEIGRLLAHRRAAFWRGAETLRAAGRLSPRGEALFVAAEEAVRACGA